MHKRVLCCEGYPGHCFNMAHGLDWKGIGVKQDEHMQQDRQKRLIAACHVILTFEFYTCRLRGAATDLAEGRW